MPTTPTAGPVTDHGSGAGTLAVTLTGVGAGDFLIVGYDLYEPGGPSDNTISSVTCDVEIDLTAVTAINQANVVTIGPTAKQFFYLAAAASAGTHVFTAHFTGTNSWPAANVIAAAYPSGCTVDDCQFEATTGAIPGCTLATTRAADAVISLLTVSASTTAGSGYTLIHLTDLNFFDYAEYTDDAGAINAALDVRYASIGSGSWHAGAVSIKSPISVTTGRGRAL